MVVKRRRAKSPELDDGKDCGCEVPWGGESIRLTGGRGHKQTNFWLLGVGDPGERDPCCTWDTRTQMFFALQSFRSHGKAVSDKPMKPG